MMTQINVIIFFGGGGNEHEVSIISKDYYKSALSNFENINLYEIEITKNKSWQLSTPSGISTDVYLKPTKSLCSVPTNKTIVETVHYAIPCIHGFPGETGQLQGIFELFNIPFFGNGVEASAICMNKVTTKLWLNQIGVPSVEFKLITDPNDEKEKSEALKFFNKFKNVFVKASSEGSSVGVFKVLNKKDLFESIEKAKAVSPYVLIEKCMTGREIEVSTYQIGNIVHASAPGEIHCPNGFYDYEEKYSPHSKTTTSVLATGLDEHLVNQIKSACIKIFKSFKLKDLARIDFFLDKNLQFYVNEINTFPGSTPISLFPLMMQKNGHQFSQFLYSAICRDLNINSEKVISS